MTLGNNMAKRSRQYAIRSTYDLLPQKKKIRKTDIYSCYNIEQPKKSKKVKIPELPGATYGAYFKGSDMTLFLSKEK